MYRKLLANMSPFSLYVLLYIMVVRISVDFIRKKMFLTEAVFILICCCALLKFISNMQYIIIYFKMILPENEFSLLKGVNNQPYLDIWTSASHLTKRFLFSCISFFFLPSYVFYIHPIGHLWAFWLCVKTSLNMRNHSYDLHQPTDSFHDNQTHFYMKGFTQRLVLKQRHKDTFIHELLTRAFDLLCLFIPVMWD